MLFKVLKFKVTGKNGKVIIRAFAVTEIAIGLFISLSFIIASLINPPEGLKSLYLFVIFTSMISVIIGIGLFRYKKWGRQFLVFFAGYVIFTKFLLLSNLVEFTGNTIQFMSTGLKDTISFIYHCSILVVFNLKDIKKLLK